MAALLPTSWGCLVATQSQATQLHKNSPSPPLRFGWNQKQVRLKLNSIGDHLNKVKLEIYQSALKFRKISQQILSVWENRLKNPVRSEKRYSPVIGLPWLYILPLSWSPWLTLRQNLKTCQWLKYLYNFLQPNHQSLAKLKVFTNILTQKVQKSPNLATSIVQILKRSTPSPRKINGRAVQKAQFFKGKHDWNLEFLEKWGSVS